MTFSDNDLKRLKENTRKNWLEDKIPLGLLPEEIRALLARLEAAEAYLNRHINEADTTPEYLAWRKAAGK